MRPRQTVLAAALAAAASSAPGAEPALQLIPVAALAAAPKVDGDLGEWGPDGWIAVPVTPALERKDRPKYGLEEVNDRNQTGRLTVQLKVGVVNGVFYLAAKVPDAAEDKEQQGWEWRGEKYVQGRQLDDMFAVRFHMAGDFDRTMLGTKDYKVDVWLWSAARTNPSGVAEDMSHIFTTKLTEDAAEYSLPTGGTVYIRKPRDAGVPPYASLPRPKENKGQRVPNVATQKASGSIADVAAKGAWKEGAWRLEFSRKLNTGNADDVPFKAGQKLVGQIGVFNRGEAEHKSVSEPLTFDFSAVR